MCHLYSIFSRIVYHFPFSGIASAAHCVSSPANWMSSTQHVMSWRPKKNTPGFMRGFTAARPLYSTVLPSYFFGSSERSRYQSA